MFAIPGIVALLIFVCVRPQDFLEPLHGAPVLYLAMALALFGYAIDLRLRRTRLAGTPLVPIIAVFFVWCLFTVGLRTREHLLEAGFVLLVSLLLGLTLGQAVQSFRAFQVIATLVLLMALFLSAIGIHQGFAPFGCYAVSEWDPERATGDYDGRSCATYTDCFEGDPEPGADYLCERVGLLGTFSVEEGRVRYLGTLQDPNELALVVGIAAPFAFALYERKRSFVRLLLLIVTLGAVGGCILLTKSRGGQLAFMGILGVYFVKRYGWRGMVVGAIFAAPIVILGGRGGEKASSSTLERIDCWYTAVHLFFHFPIAGVGAGQFLEHHFLTAHNSYLLSASELGFPGMVIWTTLMYLTVKIPASALRRFANTPEAAVARTWALALFASLVGLLIGVFFLSFCYEQMLWVYIGLAGAYYGAGRAHDPEWKVSLSLRELATIIVGDAVLLGMLYVYTRSAVE